MIEEDVLTALDAAHDEAEKRHAKELRARIFFAILEQDITASIEEIEKHVDQCMKMYVEYDVMLDY
jgi:hypothetical protein